MTTVNDELLDKLSRFDERCSTHMQTLIAHQEFWREAMRRGIEVPWDATSGTSHYVNIAQHLYNEESHESELDVAGTQKQFARIVKWARANGWKVEKNYTDDEFNIKITGINSAVDHMEFYSTRQVVCKKVQTGTKHVPTVEAHDEPVYEYVCDKVAFLSVDTD